MLEAVAGAVPGAAASWSITYHCFRRTARDTILFARKVDLVLSKLKTLGEQHGLGDEAEDLATEALRLRQELRERFDIFEELGGICPECGTKVRRNSEPRRAGTCGVEPRRTGTCGSE